MSIINWLKRNIVLVFVVGIVAIVFVGLAVNAWASDDDSGNAQTSSATATATLVSEVPSTAVAPSNTTGTAAVCPSDKEIKDPRPDSGKPTIVDPGCIVKGDVEVGSSQSGPFAPAHTDDEQGNLLECPEGCVIVADYGANVSNRTYASLETEQKATGCANNAGCTTVHHWCFSGGQLSEVTNNGTCASSNTKAPSNGNVVSNCGDELSRNETRTFPAGCIIVGDIAINGQLQKPVGRNRNDTGYVQQLTTQTTLTAPYGAAVYDSSWQVSELVQSTKLYGCDRDDGCSGGVYDWSGKRLDQ